MPRKSLAPETIYGTTDVVYVGFIGSEEGQCVSGAGNVAGLIILDFTFW